jgi:hypothetical protein
VAPLDEAPVLVRLEFRKGGCGMVAEPLGRPGKDLGSFDASCNVPDSWVFDPGKHQFLTNVFIEGDQPGLDVVLVDWGAGSMTTLPTLPEGRFARFLADGTVVALAWLDAAKVEVDGDITRLTDPSGKQHEMPVDPARYYGIAGRYSWRGGDWALDGYAPVWFPAGQTVDDAKWDVADLVGQVVVGSGFVPTLMHRPVPPALAALSPEEWEVRSLDGRTWAFAVHGGSPAFPVAMEVGGKWILAPKLQTYAGIVLYPSRRVLFVTTGTGGLALDLDAGAEIARFDEPFVPWPAWMDAPFDSAGRPRP